MATKQDITPEIAAELLNYDPGTGVLTWKPRSQKWFSYPNFHIHWNSRWAGKVAGTKNKRGYLVMNVLNRIMTAHRLAWMIHYGEIPGQAIDHINGDKTDNRLENLRSISQEKNTQNRRLSAKGKDLPLGVFPVLGSKKGKVFARIIAGKKRFYLGTFSTPEEAHKAYLKAKRELHPGCTI